MIGLVDEYGYDLKVSESTESLFKTLSAKRAKHLNNIYSDMNEFLFYYTNEFSDEEKDALLFSAKYHDLGYHEKLNFTNNHALDFVLYLEANTNVNELTKKIILFHTMSDEGLNNDYIIKVKTRLTNREQFLIMVLSYFDMQTNLKGDSVSLESRLFSVRRRKEISNKFIEWTLEVRDILIDFMLSKEKKALIFDVDNTISFDNDISKINIDKIKEFSNNGFEIIFNTGKLPHSIYEAEKKLGFKVHKICLNGNIISENKRKLKILNNIDAYKIELRRLFKMNNIEYIEYTKDGVILNDDLSEKNIRKIKDVGDYYLANESSEVIKIICFIEKTQLEKKKMIDSFIKKNQLDVVRTSEYFYEIVPINNDKGTGLLSILKDLNIYHRATLAFGDNYNDLPMFKYAGKGYIVNSATKYLKRRGYEVLNGNPKNAVGDKLNQLNEKGYGEK